MRCKVNHNNNEPTVKVSARRRLVRGVFAAPAALTLYSGGAFAATSMTCVAKDVAAGALPTAITGEVGPGSEVFIRVQLHALSKPILGVTKISTWVRGDDVVALQKTGATSFLLSGQWICFTNPDGLDVTGPIIPTPGQIIGFTPVADGGGSTFAQNGIWVALRIDASGNIIGIVDLLANPGDGAFGVHKSCWTSFRTV